MVTSISATGSIGAAGCNQKFLVAVAAFDGAFGEAEYMPMRLGGKPCGDVIAYFRMKARIPDNAAFADIFWPNLELRFDERDQIGLPGGERQCGWQDRKRVV